MTESKAGEYRRIVVGVDGSPAADEALRWAIRQAKRTGDTIQAVMAWEYSVSLGGYGWAPVLIDGGGDFQSIAEKSLADAISRVNSSADTITIEPKVVEGHAAQVLTDASAHADLLVVGSRGHGTFTDALLGSVSQHCAHHSKCPVVILRSAQSTSSDQ